MNELTFYTDHKDTLTTSTHPHTNRPDVFNANDTYYEQPKAFGQSETEMVDKKKCFVNKN